MPSPYSVSATLRRPLVRLDEPRPQLSARATLRPRVSASITYPTPPAPGGGALLRQGGGYLLQQGGGKLLLQEP